MKRGFFVFSFLFIFSFLPSFAISSDTRFSLGTDICFESEIFYRPYFRESHNITLRTDESPWCFAANVWLFDSAFVVTADNWFVNEPLYKAVNYYLFWGISGGVGFNDFSAGTGARAGGGIDWFLLDNKNLELYWQGAWNPYLGLESNDGLKPFIRPLCFIFSTGARWWF